MEPSIQMYSAITQLSASSRSMIRFRIDSELIAPPLPPAPWLAPCAHARHAQVTSRQGT